MSGGRTSSAASAIPGFPWTPRRSRLAATIAIGSAIALALAVIAWRDPAETRLFPKCLLHSLTGWHCAGCGSSRALHRLLRGDLLGAMRMNSLAVAVLPLLIGSMVRSTMRKWRGLPEPGSLPGHWILAFAGLLVLYSVLRNLPWHPFTLLAPH